MSNNGYALALSPETAEQAMKAADWMSRSQLIPKQYQGKPNDIVIACAMGARLGLDPFSALAGIAVVNGRPTLWGDAMLAVCQQRPDWGGMHVTWDGSGDDQTCTVSVSRKGVDPYGASFSVADAKRAGLWGKQGPWTQFPRRMLELRARAFALRGAFADALAGFHAREEFDDEPEEAQGVHVHAEPRPAIVPQVVEMIQEPDHSVDATEMVEEPAGVDIAALRIEAGELAQKFVGMSKSRKEGGEALAALLEPTGAKKVSEVGEGQLPGFIETLRAAVAGLEGNCDA